MEDIDSDKDKEKVLKIKGIIEKEIEKELINKQNEVTEISDKIKNILRNLDILKYVAAVNYYDQNTALVARKGQDDEDKNEEEKIQTQIHPCVKKLLPFHSNYEKSFGDLSSHSYGTRNKKKPSVNETKPVEIKKEIDSTENSVQVKSENSNNVKIPQYIPPLPNINETIGTVNSARGSVSKDCYRVVVGNISKWIPPDTREDNSTHKWMVYIRNKDSVKDITKQLRKVRYFLHESYKPHDIIDVTSPPFYLTRRGWGEFPVRVQLHFIHPLNKPVDIIHNLKLDMTCSGIQMLGSESVVEVVLHQNNSLVSDKDKGKSESNTQFDLEKKEMKEQQDIFDGSLLTSINEVLPVNSLGNINEVEEENTDVLNIKKPEEYFESDKNDFSGIEQINLEISNSRKFLLDRRKIMKIIEIEHNYLGGEKQSEKHLNKFTNSVLKMEVYKNHSEEKVFKNGTVLDSVQSNQIINNMNQELLNKMDLSCNRSEEEVFINLKSVTNKLEAYTQSKYCMKAFRHMYLVNIFQRAHASKLRTVESLVKWFVQRWPIITKLSLDPTYKTVHPYSCPSEKEFFKYNIGKQRSAEWFRAKAIQKILISLKPVIPIQEEVWTTKQILLWSKFHGYSPTSFQASIKMEMVDTDEAINKKMKFLESSSDSDEGSSDNLRKRLKITNNLFSNGVSECEKVKHLKKNKRQEYAEKDKCENKNYKEFNTYSAAGETERFGANDFRVLQPVNLVSEIEIMEIDDKGVRESPAKNKPPKLVLTAPTSKTIFNKFVNESVKQIGIKVVEEEIIPGVKCDSVLSVISQCACSFLDEFLRRSFAQAWSRNGNRCPESLELNDLLATLIEYPQFDIFTNRGLGTAIPGKTER